MRAIKKNAEYVITTAKVLSDDEEEHLRRVCIRAINAWTAPRDGLMLMVLLETGIRASELLALRRIDYSESNHSLTIYALKGSRPREIPLRVDLSRQVRRWLLDAHSAQSIRDIQPEAPLFPISYNRLYQIWKVFTPNPEKTIHSLRHTFALNMYAKTRDIKLVQTLLGHRSISNTMVYVDFYFSQHTMRELMGIDIKKK